MKISLTVLTCAAALLLGGCSPEGGPPPGTFDTRFGDPDCDGMLVNILGLRFCLKGVKSAEQRYNEQVLTDLFNAVSYASGK